MLVEELRGLGVADAELPDTCYVYGHLPATPGRESAPCLGFIAHMDTSPDFSGENVKPRIIENYDGGDVELGAGRTLSVKRFPHLPGLKGRTLITTSGDTLLGADYAYTLDGGPEGEVVFENFNACAAVVHIIGVNVHPGSAKNVMVNAGQVATEFNALLPNCDTPRYTEGYEGFFHLTAIAGTAERAELRYILRDHDGKKLEMRREMMEHIAKTLNARYGEGTVSVSFREQYRNMAEKIRPDHMHLVENAVKAAEECGVKPLRQPIRGGTDGAQLSWEGLPCPNLGTGGYAFHGPYEHITVEGMDKCVEIIRRIVEIYA